MDVECGQLAAPMRYDGLNLMRPAAGRRDDEPGGHRRAVEAVDAECGEPSEYRGRWRRGKSHGVPLGVGQWAVVGDDDAARNPSPTAGLDPVADGLAAELCVCGAAGEDSVDVRHPTTVAPTSVPDEGEDVSCGWRRPRLILWMIGR